MEFRELVGIFRRRKAIFLLTVSVFLVAGFAWQRFQPASYRSDLSLNVARRGVQDTADYRYDGFYRLQADERFADTVVEWLSSPRIVADIYSGAGTRTLSPTVFSFGGPISADRLSSQLISVRYRTTDREGAERVAKSVIARINQEADSLNVSAREKSWFMVLGGEPVIEEARIRTSVVLAVMGALGVFFGFWNVLLTHYFGSGSAGSAAPAVPVAGPVSGPKKTEEAPRKPAGRKAAIRKWGSGGNGRTD